MLPAEEMSIQEHQAIYKTPLYHVTEMHVSLKHTCIDSPFDFTHIKHMKTLVSLDEEDYFFQYKREENMLRNRMA